MALTLAEKMKIKPGTAIALFNAPADFKKILKPLPSKVSFKEKPEKKNNFILLFVENKAELEKNIFKVCNQLEKEGVIWIAYPKGSSKKQTDLTRDKGWESLDKIDMQWMSLISMDETWSAFALKNVPRKNEDSKASKEYHENKAEWADAATKTVKIPDDLKAAMVKGKVMKFFEEQNFTNRKEYVMWIVLAKQEKTRIDRIAKAVEKMKKGEKNPAGR